MSPLPSNTWEYELFSDLPARLLEKASLLAGELAWPAEDAVEVLEWLANAERAVVGVELWQNQQNMPKWIATSSYDNDHLISGHEHAIACSQDAISFVRRFEHYPGALFNLI